MTLLDTCKDTHIKKVIKERNRGFRFDKVPGKKGRYFYKERRKDWVTVILCERRKEYRSSDGIVEVPE